MSRVKRVTNRLVTRHHRTVLARRATRAVVQMHRKHRFGAGSDLDPVHTEPVAMFAQKFGAAMQQWAAEHNFADGPMKFAGEFHPDARLIAFAQSAGIPNPLDAFPPHHLVTVTPFRVTVQQLSRA